MFLFPKKKNKSSVLQCDKTHCSPVLMGNNRLKKKGEKDTDTLQRGGVTCVILIAVIIFEK